MRSWTGQVRLPDLDRAGNLLPHRVAEWMQEAAISASAEVGFTSKRYRSLGTAWLARELFVTMRGTVRHGDSLQVKTWISDFARASCRRQYQVLSRGEVVAEGEVEWIYAEIGPKGPRPLLAGDDVRQAFAPSGERLCIRPEVPTWERGGQNPEDSAGLKVQAVPYSSIDGYDHVNHVAYVAWLEDHMRARLGADAGRLDALRVRFLSGAVEHDSIAIDAWPGDTPGQWGLHIVRAGQRILRAAMRRK